jgi:hypothetical protein
LSIPQFHPKFVKLQRMGLIVLDRLARQLLANAVPSTDGNDGRSPAVSTARIRAA